MGLIDFHAHLAPTVETRDRLLSTMESVGITQAVIVGGSVLSPKEISKHIACGGGTDITVANATLLELCQSTEGKLLPFYFANPHGSTEEYERTGKQYYGLKFAAVIHGEPILSEGNAKYIEIARRFRHPVYLHCLSRPGFDLESFRSLALRYPDVTLVLGHGGIGNCDFYAVDQVKDLLNVYFETSGPFASVVKYAMEQLGEDRILFGTEYPLQNPRIELEKLKVTALSPEVLNRNAFRVLGLQNE